jgi:hypothetical protein
VHHYPHNTVDHNVMVESWPDLRILSCLLPSLLLLLSVTLTSCVACDVQSEALHLHDGKVANTISENKITSTPMLLPFSYRPLVLKYLGISTESQGHRQGII